MSTRLSPRGAEEGGEYFLLPSPSPPPARRPRTPRTSRLIPLLSLACLAALVTAIVRSDSSRADTAKVETARGSRGVWQSVWPTGVPCVFLDPSQAQVDRLYRRMRQEAAEYTVARSAILLTSNHTLSTLLVGFFTSASGVEPQVIVDQLHAVDRGGEFLSGPQTGTHGFWRSVEGVEVRGNASWSMSQASPIRRCTFRRDLALRAGGQYVSGGFISNSVVDGVLRFDGQQQYLARNCRLGGGFSESSINIVLVGCEGVGSPTATTTPSPSTSLPPSVTAVPRSHRIAEKPYLAWEGRSAGNIWEGWSIVVPSFGIDVKGVQNTSSGARWIPFWRGGERVVYVMEPSHSEEEMHAVMDNEACEAVVLAPGVYRLSRPLMIHRPGFVLLGIGLATLVCAGKGGCIEVEDGLEDVRIGGVLLEAGVTDLSRPTQPMLRWGRSTTPSPGGLLSDVHARLTAMPSIPALSPSESSADLNHLHPLPLPPLEGCSPKRADVMLQLSSSGLTLDHSWLWHADHDQCAGANASECSLPYRGTCVSDACVSSHGLLVDGNGVSAYGLQVEHHKKTLVVWRGRGGRTFMFQAELPYTEPSFSSRHVGYEVVQHALPHSAAGLGVYVIYKGCRRQVGLRVPHGAAIENMLVMHIDGLEDAFRAVVCSGDEPLECACSETAGECPRMPSLSPLRLSRLPWGEDVPLGLWQLERAGDEASSGEALESAKGGIEEHPSPPPSNQIPKQLQPLVEPASSPCSPSPLTTLFPPIPRAPSPSSCLHGTAPSLPSLPSRRPADASPLSPPFGPHVNAAGSVPLSSPPPVSLAPSKSFNISFHGGMGGGIGGHLEGHIEYGQGGGIVGNISGEIGGGIGGGLKGSISRSSDGIEWGFGGLWGRIFGGGINKDNNRETSY